MTLCEKAQQIVDDNRHASHSWRTIYVCLQYAADRDVTAAWRRIKEMRQNGIPKWLVCRWASDADLLE
jgi:hypothetical protein